MKNSPTWRVPPLDKQVLQTLIATVVRARLDAQGMVSDLGRVPDNVMVEDLRYWQTQGMRLEAGEAWLLELLGSEQQQLGK